MLVTIIYKYIAGPFCVSDCTEMPNGKYQSCDGCNFFVECKDKKKNVTRCEDNQTWNPQKQMCDRFTEGEHVRKCLDNGQ